MKKNIQQNSISFFQNELFLIALGVVIVLSNLYISFTLDRINADYILNTKPFGFDASLVVTSLIAVMAAFVIVVSKAYLRFPVAALLIISGSFSNVLERFLIGGVRDYLDISVAMINVPDLQIWLGLALLNWKIWIASDYSALSTKKNLIRKKSYKKYA